MTASHLPRRTFGAVLAFLISVLLLSHRRSSQPKDEPLKGLASRFLASEFETAFNVTFNKESRSIAVPFGDRDYTVNFTTKPRRVTRDDLSDYEYAVCKGEKLWANIQDAFDGRGPPPKQQFGSEDFKNGWTLNIARGQPGISKVWEDAFTGFANNRIPIGDEVSALNALQDKFFRNSAGRLVRVPTGGSYLLQYVPLWSAMIAMFVQSPSARLQNSMESPYGQVIAKENLPQVIPPLHRLSDLSWYIYSLIGNPGNIRYIGHDNVANTATNDIMDHIFSEHYDDTDPDLPWPGLVLDIDTDEAKALLSTPNSLGVAYMMIDHAAVLGRRHPKVYLFNGIGVRTCMLWDLAPAGP
ncbi:MAG: hypothetical protein Q9166_004938 [cf. Caloplaca sp. 2 TL-2023]